MSNKKNVIEEFKKFKQDDKGTEKEKERRKTDKVKSSDEHKSGNHKKSQSITELPTNDFFLYVKGEVRFEEVDKGMIRCGGCGEVFAQIVGHLTKNPSCSHNVDIEDFKSIWSKFSARRRQHQCRNKKDNKQLLEEEAKRKRIAYQDNRDKETGRKRKAYHDKKP